MRNSVNKKYVPMDQRPRCKHPGCNKPGQHLGTYDIHGNPNFRPLCTKHHNEKTAAAHGLKNITEVIAAKRGITVTEYLNQMHPYRKHRKDYCENIDTRLGFECTYTITNTAQLQVDHIDGNPDNNSPENLQTLCANCHIHKTHANKDYATPGRKAIKKQKMFTSLLSQDALTAFNEIFLH